MKKNLFEKNYSIRKVNRRSRTFLKKDILQIWNLETDEIEYYRGNQLIRTTLLLMLVITFITNSP